MSDGSVYVNFGGNASELEASIAQAKAALRSYTSELAEAARAQAKAGESASVEMGEKLLAAASKVSQAKGELRDFQSQLRELESVASGGAKSAMEGLTHAMEGGGHGAGAGFYGREVHALVDELTSGRIHQAQGTFTNLAFTFLQGQASLVPYVAALAAAAAVLGTLAYEAGSTNLAIQRLDASAEGGRFNATGAEALKLRDQFVELASVSKSTALDILASFDSLGAGGRDLAVALVPVAEAMARAKGIDLTKAYEELAKTFSSLKTEGRAYLDTITGLTLAQREEWQQLENTGRAGDAALFVANALRAQYSQTTSAVIANTAANHAQRDALVSGQIAVTEYGQAIEPLAEGENRVTDATQAMSRAFDEAGDRARALMNASDVTASHLREDAEKIVSSVSTISAEAKKIDAEMATVKMQMAASLGDPKAMQELEDTYRRLNQSKVENTQKSGDPLRLDRDSIKQDEDALKHYDDTFRGSDQARLSGHIAMLKQMLGAEQLTDAQRHQLQQDLESSDKQLYDSQTKAGEKANKDVLSAALASIEGQIRALEDHTRAALEHYSAEVKLKEITESQKSAFAIKALAEEQKAVDALYQKELALADLPAPKRNEISTKQTGFDDKVALEMQEANEKAAEAVQKQWDGAFKEINSAFDSQISGLLRGTTSWGQAMKNVLASLVEDLTKFFVNWGLQEVEKTIQSVALGQTRVEAHVAGNAQIAASDAGAAVAGGLAWGASALKQIEASAAEAFAGVFGWLAPILGPGAAGPAAAAEASVLSVGASVASADIGMWSVPGDMLTMVHHNELIMPAAESGAFRSMLSGAASGGEAGGRSVSVNPQLHFHNNAIDSRGLEGMFRDNGGALTKAVAQAVRDGAHLGIKGVRR